MAQPFISQGMVNSFRSWEESAMLHQALNTRSGQTLPCRINADSGVDRIREIPRVEAIRRWRLAFPFGSDVVAGDCYIITDLSDPDAGPRSMGRYVGVQSDDDHIFQSSDVQFAFQTHLPSATDPYGFGAFNIPLNATVTLRRPSPSGGGKSVTISAANTFIPGRPATIAGATPAGYNASWNVQVASSGSFQITTPSDFGPLLSGGTATQDGQAAPITGGQVNTTPPTLTLDLCMMQANEIPELDVSVGLVENPWLGVCDALVRYPAPDNGPPNQGDTLIWDQLRLGRVVLDRVQRTLEPIDRFVFYAVDTG